MIRLIACASLFLVMTGCATLTDSEDSTETVLFNPVLNSQSLEVSVMSNGCTVPEHFYLVVRETEIELRRIEPDVCRAMPRLVRLEFDYEFAAGVYEFVNQTRFSNRIRP